LQSSLTNLFKSLSPPICTRFSGLFNAFSWWELPGSTNLNFGKFGRHVFSYSVPSLWNDLPL